MTVRAPKRILVVEDDWAVAELLTIALEEYEVRTAADAEAALELVAEFRPDLFILDVMLPGMRGTSLAARLRSQVEFAETPIFLISGLIEPSAGKRQPVRVNGVPGFSKPFHLMTLLRHVEAHLAGGDRAEAALAELEPGRFLSEALEAEVCR